VAGADLGAAGEQRDVKTRRRVRREGEGSRSTPLCKTVCTLDLHSLRSAGSMKMFPAATLPVLALRAHWLQALKTEKDHSGFFQSHRGLRASKNRRASGVLPPMRHRADENDNLSSLKLGTATRENL